MSVKLKTKLLFLLRHNIFVFIEYGQSKKQFEYFRIVISLFSLFNFVLFLVDYKTFLLPDGIINWEVTNANSFWFELHLLKISNLLNVDSRVILYTISVIYIVALSLLALGIFTRLSSIIAFSIFLIFSIQLYPFLYGVDLYQSVFLLILCTFPSGYSVSLKPKIADTKIHDRQKIGIRGIQLYLALTYFSAGFGKIKMDSWFNGKFFFLSLTDPNYQLISFPKNLPYYFYVFFGILVVICELTYFILILVPYIRTLLLFVLITMHLFIALFMGLVPFGLLLILINIVSWYPLILKDAKSIFKKRYEPSV